MKGTSRDSGAGYLLHDASCVNIPWSNEWIIKEGASIELESAGKWPSSLRQRRFCRTTSMLASSRIDFMAVRGGLPGINSTSKTGAEDETLIGEFHTHAAEGISSAISRAVRLGGSERSLLATGSEYVQMQCA